MSFRRVEEEEEDEEEERRADAEACSRTLSNSDGRLLTTEGPGLGNREVEEEGGGCEQEEEEDRSLLILLLSLLLLLVVVVLPWWPPRRLRPLLARRIRRLLEGGRESVSQSVRKEDINRDCILDLLLLGSYYHVLY